MADKRTGRRGRPKGTTKGGLKYLDEGQLKAFFQAIRKTKDSTRRLRDDLGFSLIVFYGLRVCELARLKMGDLDLRGRQLRVAAAKGGLTRTEDIPADIWRKLEAWLKKREKGEWLFPGRLPGQVNKGGLPCMAPIGYLNVADPNDPESRQRTVVVDPVRAPLVRTAFELYNAGEYSIISLLAEMTNPFRLGQPALEIERVEDQPRDLPRLRVRPVLCLRLIIIRSENSDRFEGPAYSGA